jgi:CheY-like chemotaxis protein
MEKKGRILIVDDDKDIRTMLGAVLSQKGFEPVTVNSAIKALEVMRKTDDIVLIILDWMMPGITGMEFMEQLHEFEDVPPIIMISAKADIEDVQIAVEAGIEDYVVKPVDIDILLHKINTILVRESELTKWRLNRRKELMYDAHILISVKDILPDSCVLESSFPLEKDAVIFITCDRICDSLKLPRGHKFSVRIKSCEGIGKSYRVMAEFVGMREEHADKLQKTAISGEWLMS